MTTVRSALIVAKFISGDYSYQHDQMANILFDFNDRYCLASKDDFLAPTLLIMTLFFLQKKTLLYLHVEGDGNTDVCHRNAAY